MKFEQAPKPQQLSEENIGKIEKERVLSDAELIKGGAEYTFNEKGEKRLDITNEQEEELKEKITEDSKAEIEQKLDLQNLRASIAGGKLARVKVKRSSGKTEDGWFVTDSDNKKAFVVKDTGDGEFIRKIVPIEKLKEWNTITFEKGMDPDEITRRIQEIKNFEDLFNFIDESKCIEGTKEFFTAEKLKNIIDNIRSGNLPINFVTRTGGLRQKVQELLEEEEQEKEIESS